MSPIALIVIALSILGAMVGLLVAATSLDIHARVLGRPASLSREGPIGTVDEIVDEPASALLVGRTVSLQPTAVHEVVADAVFWVGTSEERRVPVLMIGERMGRQPEDRVQIAAGQRAIVYGTVEAVRASSLLSGSELIEPNERRALLERELYISASRVVVAGAGGDEPPRSCADRRTSRDRAAFEVGW
jgi:hypothetical protein